MVFSNKWFHTHRLYSSFGNIRLRRTHSHLYTHKTHGLTQRLSKLRKLPMIDDLYEIIFWILLRMFQIQNNIKSHNNSVSILFPILITMHPGCELTMEWREMAMNMIKHLICSSKHTHAIWIGFQDKSVFKFLVYFRLPSSDNPWQWKRRWEKQYYNSIHN